MTAIIRFGDVTLRPIPDPEHEWTLTTPEVANGLECDPSSIRHAVARHGAELIEGRHWHRVTNRHADGRQAATVWTKRGVIRLSFFIRSPRAKQFRDFAEDLVLSVIEQRDYDALLTRVTELERRLNALAPRPSRRQQLGADDRRKAATERKARWVATTTTPIRHGTLYGYASRKCRCGACTEAGRAYRRARSRGSVMTTQPTKLPTLADFIPESGDDLAAAIATLRAIGVTGEARRLLTPVMIDFVRNQRRTAVRVAEGEAFRQSRPAPRNVRKDGARIAAKVAAERLDPQWTALLAMPFRITRGGKIVTWGEATADEHEAKAANLERAAAGTLVTAERHRLAAKAIREAGAASLNDMYRRAAA